MFKLANAYVYILTNNHNTTLYIGVTNDLRTRLWEHRTKQDKYSFAARYNLHKLVYFETFASIVDAIAREKVLKGKARKFKNALIESVNPEWKDLSDQNSGFH